MLFAALGETLKLFLRSKNFIFEFIDEAKTFSAPTSPSPHTQFFSPNILFPVVSLLQNLESHKNRFRTTLLVFSRTAKSTEFRNFDRLFSSDNKLPKFGHLLSLHAIAKFPSPSNKSLISP
ncbi:hypothetical protein MHBO_001165 [Bonamia ostreae]|uniref:Uncharacterized protein n=1 Tax=Bonamia ostreae TaxID=126728 RepID=A0ABV2AHZ6_9EUKA